MAEWHLDKRVPVALIFAIVVQTFGVAWWASQTSERLTQVEKRLEAFADRNERTDRQVDEQSRQIAVLTEQVANTNRNLESLKVELSGTNELLRELIRQRLPFRGSE